MTPVRWYRTPLRRIADGLARTVWALTAGAVTLAATVAQATDYPQRPVRIVVAFPPGAGNDIQARLLARKLHESMGQPFVVENRPGASGNIGAEVVARAPADGYSLLFISPSLAANATLYPNLAFDALRDFAPITLFSVGPHFLVVPRGSPAESVAELVALARRHPHKLNAGSNGIGTQNHIGIEMLQQAAGIAVTHVPYRGGAGALSAVLSGEVDLAFLGAAVVLPHIRKGSLRALAVTSAKPSAAAPELPTMSTTLPDFEYSNWYALFAPAGTPPRIINKVSAAANRALQATEFRELLRAEGVEPAGTTPEETAAFFRHEVARLARVIRAAGMKVE